MKKILLTITTLILIFSIFQMGVMATAWDVSTIITYAADVSNQDNLPFDVTFSPDGTKMYIVGYGTDTVYQYTLTIAWDVGTASYADKSKLVGTQDTEPMSLAFNLEGTKMYVVGISTDTVYQYTLSTGWDVSTATYTDKSKNVSTQDTSPNSVTFSSDGSKMYVMGTATDTVYQYTVSTPWDVDTATYADKSKLMSTQDISPEGVTFISDGSKMYVVGKDTDTVYQYTLTTAWDVGTASYSTKSVYIGDQETTPRGITFSPDGTKMYIVGYGTDTVYQYTLTIAWDVGTASYSIKSAYLGGQDIFPHGVDFSTIGTKMYIIGVDTHTVYQYTLTTDWDVDTAVYATKSVYIGDQDIDSLDVTFSPDGTKMYIIGVDTHTVYQYTLTTDWDVGTASYATKSVYVGDQDIKGASVTFNSDGTKMYIVGYGTDTVYQYTLTIAWDVGTASYSIKSAYVGGQDIFPLGLAFSSDGLKMYIVGDNTDTVYQYTLTTAWDVGTASYATKSVYIGSQDDLIHNVTFSSGGTRMYIVGSRNETVYQYSLPKIVVNVIFFSTPF